MTPAAARKKLASLPTRSAAFVESMECLAVAKLPDGPQWIYEIKLDGYRAQAVKSDTNLTLYSRRRKSFNRQFPHIVEALSDLPENTVVDGEVLALHESGRPDFNLLQNFRAEASRIHYFVFDLLVYQNRDLTRLPHISRLLRLPGFTNRKYNEAFVVRVHHETDSVYHLQDFRVQEDSPESSRHPGDSQMATRRITPGHRSQSEADWAYAKRALARGDAPEEVIRRIADYRAEEKADPLYYARLTVTKAHADFHAKHADETRVTRTVAFTEKQR
jgi:ATP dependent DNA ligase domain